MYQYLMLPTGSDKFNLNIKENNITPSKKVSLPLQHQHDVFSLAVMPFGWLRA
jgi:hypothetical protein